MLWQAAALFSSKSATMRSGTKAALMWRSSCCSGLSVLLQQPKRWRLRTWNKGRCRAPHSLSLTSSTKPSEAAPRLPFLLSLRRTFYLLSGCDWCGNALASGGSLLLQISSGAEWNQGGADVEISWSQRHVCYPPTAEEVAAKELKQGGCAWRGQKTRV
ncbi:hypothetical protein Droror1_Dr00018431 [Drosera rotundifolia]